MPGNPQNNTAFQLGEAPFSDGGADLEGVIEVNSEGGKIYSAAFLPDGRHLVGGGSEMKIRHWRTRDGSDVGNPMDAGGCIFSVAVSRDGKLVAGGTGSDQVIVWNVETHEKVREFGVYKPQNWVRAVDISPDGTRIASGSGDKMLSVWSISTGQRLLGPLEHQGELTAVKYSPDGRLISTATLGHRSIQIYDSQEGQLLFSFPIQVSTSFNRSLAWSGDSKELFALSREGDIKRFDASTGNVRASEWRIHSRITPSCIALANNGKFIVASANSAISFWDTTTHEQIGSIIEHPDVVNVMAISRNYNLATGPGDETMTIRNLGDLLPLQYIGDILPPQGLEDTPEIGNNVVEESHIQDESLNEKFANLGNDNRELRAKLAQSQRSQAARDEEIQRLKKEKADLEQNIESFRAQAENSNKKSGIRVRNMVSKFLSMFKRRDPANTGESSTNRA